MEQNKTNLFKRTKLWWVNKAENKIPFVKKQFERKQYGFAFKLYSLIRILQNAYFGKREIKMLEVNSVKSYAALNNLDYDVVIPSGMVDCVGPDFTHQPQLKSKERHPEIYIAQLNNVKVVGGYSFLIGKPNKIIFNEFEVSKLNEIDYNSANVPFMDYKRIVLDRFIPTKKEKKIPKAINLCGKSMHNYYHLLIEMMPKISLFKNLPESFKNAPVVLDSGVKTYPQLLELLDTYLPDTHERIYIDSLEMIEVEELIVLSPLVWFPYYGKEGTSPKYEDYIFHPQAISFIRKAIAQPTIGDRKIYLSRKATNRRKANEQDIIEALVPLGFEVVFTEQLSFKEQIDLFQSAKYIVGATGAAFTNLVFCNKNTNAIILAATDWEFGLFSNIAHSIGMNLKYVIDTSQDKKELLYHSSFQIDTNTLVSELKKLN